MPCVERPLKIKIAPLGINAFLAPLQQHEKNKISFDLFLFSSVIRRRKIILWVDVKVKSITAVISCSHFLFQLAKQILFSLFCFAHFLKGIKGKRCPSQEEEKKKKNRNNMYRWWAFYFRDRDPGRSLGSVFFYWDHLSTWSSCFAYPFKLAVVLAFLLALLATWQHQRNVGAAGRLLLLVRFA